MSALYALAAFAMTLAGGAFAFRYQRYLLYIMAASAGLLIGVAFLDLIPEVVELAHQHGIAMRSLMVTVILGFAAIFLLEKLTIIHSEKQHDAPGHHHNVGLVGALGLSFHSFLDGLAIGVGFEAGAKVGFIVLLAVVAHDFADGLNTVSLMLAHHNTTRRSLFLLALDALAPFLGAISTLFFHVPPDILALYLGFFGGFLLYISAADILPEAHSRKPARVTIVMTCLGALFIFLVIRVAG